MIGRTWRLKEDHPSIGDVCPFCENSIRAGELVTLHALPPKDPEELAKALAGRAHTTEAKLMHAQCKMVLDETAD